MEVVGESHSKAENDTTPRSDPVEIEKSCKDENPHEEGRERVDNDGAEEKKAPPIAKDNSRITADARKSYDGFFDYDDGDGELRYPFQYRKIPWKRRNQLRMQSLSESVESQEGEERLYQEMVMDESIITLNGSSWKDFSEYQLEGSFGEAFRVFLFDSDGITRIPREIVGKLTEELKPFVSSQIEEMKKGNRRKRKY